MLPWLKRALVKAHRSGRAKAKAKEPLCVPTFSRNLKHMCVFGELQAYYCRSVSEGVGEG